MTNAAQKLESNMTSTESTKRFFQENLAAADPAIKEAIDNELNRQQTQIELIASENIASQAVIDALGTVFTNKYAEGYPGKRYYGGCEFADVVEQLAIDRVCELFGSKFANVQPHSGAQANGAVMLALTQPGDTILGMSLASGGHLTHGAKPALSGKWYNAVQYGVREEDQMLDYDEIEALAKEHKPTLIIAGASAYPRPIDWARFRKIADEVGAKLMVDMAHYAGLVAAGTYPSPIPFADVVTSTTHKTLRGPRGGIILTNDEVLAKKFNSAVFPGLQGGPLVNVIAAKAVAFREALEPSFKAYGQAIIDNARALGEVLVERGAAITTGGTDAHLIVVDLRPKGVTGKAAEESLERAGLTCNKNAIPFDPEKPFVTSGIRLGTPCGTTRGFGEEEFKKIGHLISDVLDGLVANPEDNSAAEKKAAEGVKELCGAFPIY